MDAGGVRCGLSPGEDLTCVGLSDTQGLRRIFLSPAYFVTPGFSPRAEGAFGKCRSRRGNPAWPGAVVA
jgi:hypothetical protein